MNADSGFVPDGYQPRRPLSERDGSWVWLASNPEGNWCCLKIQKVSRPETLGTLVAHRKTLQALSQSPGFIRIRSWGADVGSGTLWEELELADDAITERPFDPGSVDTYTPLTLHGWTVEHGAAENQRLLSWGIRLASGLVTLHSEGLFHRDVKPSNILFVRGEPVLGDFGSIGCEGAPVEFPGTEGYVPPDGLGSAALDVFALGRTLYEVWTGYDRFRFPSLPPGMTQAPGWDSHGWMLNDALCHAADSRPSQRLATAEQFLSVLTQAAVGRQRINRRAWGVGVLSGLSALGCAYIWRNRPSHKAQWRRLSSGPFGYEMWAGSELSCDWSRRVSHSLNWNGRLGLTRQRVNLRDWRHEEQNWNGAPLIDRHLLHPESGELWGIASRTGRILRVPIEGDQFREQTVTPVDDTRFTGRLYWNPLTRRVGKFNGYGNFGCEISRREFNESKGTWDKLPEIPGSPWPRTEPLTFSAKGGNRWFLFGGRGNSTGRQGDREPGIPRFDGEFHPLGDLWELDLAQQTWRSWWKISAWNPVGIRDAIYHPRLDAVVFLEGSEPGKAIPAKVHLWLHGQDSVPLEIPSLGERSPLYRCWTLLVEPESGDLWVFTDEGVFAVGLKEA